MSAEKAKAPEAKAPPKNPSAPAPAAPVVPHVLQAISAVAATMAMVGIGKDRTNEQQKFKFRGIDDVLNALSPVLSANKLIIVPRMTKRIQTERATKQGGAMFSVVVEAAFDFTSVVDGSIVTVTMFGEAMDSGDKATNKAMSAAYKYAAFQTFCIPTEGDNDADATTPPPVIPRITAEQVDAIKALAASAGVDMAVVCQKAKVDAIEDLHPDGFDPVVKKLKATIAKNTAAPQSQQEEQQRTDAPE